MRITASTALRLAAGLALSLAAAFGGAATAAAQPAGLVAAYGFNEGTGTTVADSSGNNNNGVISNATWTTQGRFGNALTFNGTNALVTIPDSPSLRLTTAMTLSAWVRPVGVGWQWWDVIYKGNDNYYLSATSTNNTLPAGGGTFAGTTTETYGAVPLASNTWTHLAATYDGSTVRLFVNGVQVSTLAMTGNLTTSSNPLQIGGDSIWGQFFQGTIDEVRVYNRALAVAEVQADMNAAVGTVADTTAPTVAITGPTSATTYITNASPLTLAGTAADNIAVASVTWSNDRGGSGTATGTTTWSASGIVLQPGTNVLTVTARDGANNPATATLTVSYDPTLPTASFTAPTTGATYVTTSTPLSISGTAADNIGVTQVTWSNSRGGSGTATGTTAWSVASIALQPGDNILTVTARDAANNAGTATLTVTYTIPDTTPPTVTITGPTGGATYTTNASPLTLGGTAADNVGVTQVTWANDRGGSGTATGTTTWSASGIVLQPGTNVLTVTARDASSNPATATLTVSYDPTLPTASFTAPTTGATYVTTSTPLSISGTAADNIGVTQVTWSNSRGGSGTATGTTAWSVASIALQPGDNILTVTARDAANNVGTATLTVTYNIPDTTPPTVTITGPTGGTTYTTNASPLTLGGTAADNVGVTQVTWANDRGGSGTATGTTSWSVSGIVLQPGTNVLTVTARDAATNPGTATLTVNYDPTVPTASITVPTSGPTYLATSSPLALSGSAADNIGVTQVTWSNNRGGSGTATGTTAWSVASVALQPGDNILTITARDAANNVGTATLTVTYNIPDTTSPTVSITGPTGGATYTTNASPLTLGGTAADNVGVTQVTWVNDRGGSGTATGTTSWSAAGIALQSGTNVLTVTARDAALNTGSATLTVTYDATPPTATITVPTSGTTYTTSTSTLALSGTAADNLAVSQVTWSNNRGGSGTATGTTSWSVASITLQPGDNILTVTARDGATNTGTATLTVTYNVPDTTPPTVSITAPTGSANFSTNTTPLNLSGTAGDNVGVTQVTWVNDRGGSGTATGTTAWSVTGVVLQPGANVLTLTARDAANNPATATLTVSYDPTAPTVSLTAPAPAATVSGNTTVSATAADNIAVVGVQFLLDGANLGAEVTTAPYSVTWTTSGVGNGSHTLSARARDAAGNTTLATNVAVTVANATGLVAAYTFNEGAGSVVNDTSGNNNHGTLNAGVTWTTAGKNGGALTFNGTSGIVTIPDSASLWLTNGMTLSAWVRPTVVSSAWRDVIYKGNDNWYLSATSTVGNLPAGGGTFAGTTTEAYGTAALAVNTWTHLAVTYDGTIVRLYVNGTQVSTLARTGNLLVSTNPLQLGGDSFWGQFFQGNIDDVRVYNRALTATEIGSDMNTPVGGTPPPDTTPPTVAITGPTSGSTYSTNASGVTLSGTSADSVGVTTVTWVNSRGGSGTATGTTSWSASGIVLQPGSNVLTVTARDAANNPGTATLTVSYDPTVPTIGITAPTTNPTYTTSTSPLPLSGTAADNIAVSQVTWSNSRGGSGTATGTTSWSVAGVTLQPGDNILTVTARDAANNAGTATLTVTYTAPDTTPPTVAFSAPTSGATFSTNATPLTISGTAADNVGVSTVTWTSDRGGSGSATGTTAWSVTGVVLQPGANVLTVTARDAANNPGTATLTVTYDATAPTVSLTAPAAGSVSGNVTVSATAGDNIGVVGVQFLLDGANLGTEVTAAPYSLSWNTTAAANGSHTLSARARDAAGNTTLATNVAVSVANAQPTGLMAAYAFNEGGGTTVIDTSGNNNTGTLGSGVTWTTQGKNGNALVFNGASFVTIPHTASLNLTTAMTLEAWLYPTVTPTAWSSALMKEQTGEFVYVLYAGSPANRPSAQFNVNNSTSGSGERAVTAPAALPINTWTHMAGTFDGTTLRLYINGSLVASQAFAGPIFTSTGALRIGGNGVWGEYFTGRIDDVRVYNRALSAAEIQTDLATPVSGTPPPDTTPPTITIASPTEGSSVTGYTTVTANASDNVAVAGVQFLLDGANLGAEVTSPPFSVVWDSSTATPGAHTLTARARDFATNTATSAAVHVTVTGNDPALVGHWSQPFFGWPIVGLHSVLLRSGHEILIWEQSFGGNPQVLDLNTMTFTEIPISTNIFCAGHCQLPDGRVFAAGGHIDNHVGLNVTHIFDPTTQTWTPTRTMASGRWYPTVTSLPDGRMLIVGGEIDCDTCDQLIPEIYNPANNTMTRLTGAPLDLPYYPHAFVLADGRVLVSSSSEHPVVARTLNINTQTWTVVDPALLDGGSSVMYRPGMVMKAGSSTEPDFAPVPSVATTYVLDMNQPTPAWQQTASMAFPRTYHTLTSLPDGNVLVTGGGMTTNSIGIDQAVYAAELWSPASKTWTTLSSGQIPRLYHSTATLLPDGRVLVGAGGRAFGSLHPTDQYNSEFFSPPYLFKGARPTITSAPTTATWGANITVQTPDAASIASAVLIRLASVTHAFNTGQHYVPVTFTKQAGSLTVQMPANANAAPPGFYMLFIVNTNGVPSVAPILQLQ